jgi:hypothetical protein
MKAKTLVLYSYITNHKRHVTLRTSETVTAKIRDRAKTRSITLARRNQVPDRIIDKTYRDAHAAVLAGTRAGFDVRSVQQIVSSDI